MTLHTNQRSCLEAQLHQESDVWLLLMGPELEKADATSYASDRRTHWRGRQGEGRRLRGRIASQARQAGHHAGVLRRPRQLVGEAHGRHLLLLRLLQRVLQLQHLLLLLTGSWSSCHRRPCGIGKAVQQQGWC